MMVINAITIGMSYMCNKLEIPSILIGIVISLIVASNAALSITPTAAAKASSLTPWQLFLIICPSFSPQSPQCPILLQQILPFYQQQQSTTAPIFFPATAGLACPSGYHRSLDGTLCVKTAFLG
jgi:hypothetical protein